MSRDGRRLGVIGGTFDPIHWGHLDAALTARERLSLTDLLFIPSHVPPHRPRQPQASAFHRFAMTALAIQDIPDAAVSDIELTRTGPSYSIDTLVRLHADGWSASQIFFIIGTDAFAEIATWRGFPGLLDACHFAVISRGGAPVDLAPAACAARAVEPGAVPADAGRTAVIPVPAHTRPVSSTDVRARLARGEAISAMVPAPVDAHISRHGLYRPDTSPTAR